jgi:hypothetical protein
MKSGDIILTGNNIMPLTWLIRLLTWSRYSHAEIYVGAGKTVGAHFNGIHESRLEDQAKSWKYVRVMRPKEASALRQTVVRQTALGLVGRGYDFIHLLQYAWRILLGTLGKAPIADDPSRHVCLELAAYCWHRHGVKVGGEYADNVTGRSIVNDPKLITVF